MRHQLTLSNLQGEDPAGVVGEAGGQRAGAERDPSARGGGPQARDRGVHRAHHEEPEAPRTLQARLGGRRAAPPEVR